MTVSFPITQMDSWTKKCGQVTTTSAPLTVLNSSVVEFPTISTSSLAKTRNSTPIFKQNGTASSIPLRTHSKSATVHSTKEKSTAPGKTGLTRELKKLTVISSTGSASPSVNSFTVLMSSLGARQLACVFSSVLIA